MMDSRDPMMDFLNIPDPIKDKKREQNAIRLRNIPKIQNARLCDNLTCLKNSEIYQVILDASAGLGRQPLSESAGLGRQPLSDSEQPLSDSEQPMSNKRRLCNGSNKRRLCNGGDAYAMAAMTVMAFDDVDHIEDVYTYYIDFAEEHSIAKVDMYLIVQMIIKGYRLIYIRNHRMNFYVDYVYDCIIVPSINQLIDVFN